MSIPSVPSLVRIAAVIASIQYAAHAVLFLRAKPSHGKEEIELMERMKAQRWNFSGFMRSYWDFYFGYGLLAILWGAIEVALLWQLAAHANTDVFWARWFVATLLVANIAHAILTLRYFFLQPVVFDVVIAIVLALALLR